MPKEDNPRVPIDKCISRRLYKLGCRNLTYGVYDGNEGFIGIRQKFKHRFLFTEYHWDQGPPWGTVHTVVDTGIDLPEDIELRETIDVGEHSFTTYKPLFEWLEKQGGSPTDVGPPSIRDVLKKTEDS
jgi:hypothetical protein